MTKTTAHSKWRQPILSEEFRAGLVSVIIPTHNRASLLPATITSVKQQTYPNWEIVLADDGSTDGTESLARGSIVPGQLVYLRGEHLGAQSARNLGMAHCRGEFIQFLDSDDLLHPEKLAIQIAALARDTSLDFSISSAIWSDCPERHPAGPKGGPPRMPMTIENLRGTLCITPAPLFRRSSLRPIGRWDEELAFAHESNFFGRALAHGLLPTYQTDAIAYARTHGGRLSGSLRYRQVLAANAQAYERVRSEAERNGRKVHDALSWSIHNDLANTAVIDGDTIRAIRELTEAERYYSDEFSGPRRNLWLRRFLLKSIGARLYRHWWIRRIPIP